MALKTYLENVLTVYCCFYRAYSGIESGKNSHSLSDIYRVKTCRDFGLVNSTYLNSCRLTQIFKQLLIQNPGEYVQLITMCSAVFLIHWREIKTYFRLRKMLQNWLYICLYSKSFVYTAKSRLEETVLRTSGQILLNKTPQYKKRCRLIHIQFFFKKVQSNSMRWFMQLKM